MDYAGDVYWLGLENWVNQPSIKFLLGSLQLTPNNSREPKSISPGFPSYIYCNFTLGLTRTLGNLNLPLTRSHFYFPSDHYYIILPSITRTTLWALNKSKKKTVCWCPKMYFLALRNARCFSALHTDVLVFVAWVIFDSVRDYLLSGI